MTAEEILAKLRYARTTYVVLEDEVQKSEETWRATIAELNMARAKVQGLELALLEEVRKEFQR